MIVRVDNDYFPNSIYQLIFVMDKCCVFFETGTGFLAIIQISFGFKGLMYNFINNSEKTHLAKVSFYLSCKQNLKNSFTAMLMLFNTIPNHYGSAAVTLMKMLKLSKQLKTLNLKSFYNHCTVLA
jgi:hypothetical protein